MHLPLIDRIRSFIQAEAVLVVATLAALLSACLFPPTPQNWTAYAEAIDWRTIGLLFCLMTVVAGFTRAGLLARVRSLLTRTEGTQRRLSLLLVTLSFFTAMIVTNDVALISFAPLTLLLFQGSEQRSTIITLVEQTVAANLGSMMTPIGNPQNIYLYSAFELELGEFLTAIAPYGLIGFLASIAPCMLVPNTAATLGEVSDSKVDARLAFSYGALFLLALACVGRAVSWELCVLITVIGCLVFDRGVLRHIDYSLLVTFVCFFIFVGNIKHVQTVADALQSLVVGHEVLVSALASQVISNVPAAIMLSGFTGNGIGLLIGTNIGGLGTPVASLASLITLRAYGRSHGAQTGRYLLWFTLINIALLVLFLALAAALTA